MRLLDERRYRRDAFNEDLSVPVEMASGSVWFFPKPYVAFQPVFKEGKPADLIPFYSHGPELDPLIDLISETEDETERLVLMLGLAAKLMLQNYDLTDHELNTLLYLKADEPTTVRVLVDVFRIASYDLPLEEAA